MLFSSVSKAWFEALESLWDSILKYFFPYAAAAWSHVSVLGLILTL